MIDSLARRTEALISESRKALKEVRNDEQLRSHRTNYLLAHGEPKD